MQTTLSLRTAPAIGSQAKPTYAGATFAYAENVRICSVAHFNVQCISLNRLLRCVDFGRTQTAALRRLRQ
jgi:hypothetical protein